MIDSKPVQPPYLSLVPFKSFGNKDTVNSVLNKDMEHGGGRSMMGNKNSSVKWDMLLHEDLEELLKEKAAIPIDNKKLKTQQTIQNQIDKRKSLNDPS